MALVEADDDLSIQVHPDDRMAQILENKPYGKNESFFTIDAPTCGKMYNGCKAANVEDMKQKIAAGKISETLDMMPCKAGDYVYVVAGTLHAATAGSLHFEIEENCEKTYRFGIMIVKIKMEINVPFSWKKLCPVSMFLKINIKNL